jgi:hypothetical protein
MSNELLATLGQLLSGVSSAQAAEPRPMPFPMVDVQKGHRPMPPMVTPPNGPMPTPRPDPGLPGGTFTPNRQQLPQQGPVPTPRPMPPPPVQTAPPAGQIVQQQPQSQNPLMKLFGGGASGGDWRQMLRSAGAGMAAIDPRNDDPFSTFGNSLTGATGYYDTEAQRRREEALAADKTQYDRGQDQVANSRADAELELRKAADARAARTAGYANQMSALEIKRAASANGVTPSQYMDAREQARKEVIGNGDLSLMAPEERSTIEQQIEERTNSILGNAGYRPAGISGSGGLSTDGGLSGAPEKGTVQDGYTYLGGDPSLPESWQKN